MIICFILNLRDEGIKKIYPLISLPLLWHLWHSAFYCCPYPERVAFILEANQPDIFYG